MNTKVFLLGCALGLPTLAFGAPNPALPLAIVEQSKARAFLDGVVVSYRNLISLSVDWHLSAHNHQNAQAGSFAWHHLKPAQVRFENQTTGYVMVSDGKRTYWGGAGTIARLRPLVEGNTIGDVSLIETDEMTPFFLSGQNPLRAPSGENARPVNDLGTYANASARLLNFAMVNGVRCRGVRIENRVEGRDTTSTFIYSLWFDRHNLLRRIEKNDSGVDTLRVDFTPRANVKLAPTLFRIPKVPISGN